eukprot:2772939-Amphidinium_carterae.1
MVHVGCVRKIADWLCEVSCLFSSLEQRTCYGQERMCCQVDFDITPDEVVDLLTTVPDKSEEATQCEEI